MTEMRVGVLFGGKSGEHEVSLASARTVIAALEEAGYATVPIGISPEGRWLTSDDPMARLTSGEIGSIGGNGNNSGAGYADTGGAATAFMPIEDRLPALDVIFPVLHGPFGEDGTVQGLLEMAGLPYVGDGVLASATGMDKITSKIIFGAAGLPQVAYRALFRREWQIKRIELLDKIEGAFAYPLFVKPANLGSSVGVSKVRDRGQLSAAIDLACTFDRRVLVEQAWSRRGRLRSVCWATTNPRPAFPARLCQATNFTTTTPSIRTGAASCSSRHS